MILYFRAQPGEDIYLKAGDTINYVGEVMDVISVTEGVVSIAMSSNLSIIDHRLALSMACPHETFTLLEEQSQRETKAHLQNLNLDAVDLVNFKSKSTPVWNSLFVKPPPVFDRRHWASTEESDSYIYIPNCTKYAGEETEDFNSNAMYTQIILNSYKLMCEEEGINPMVRLASGAELPVLSVETRHGVRNDMPGERAAGLANSTLVDFDDSKYGTKYLECVVNLGSRFVAKEPARRTVLAKCEYILAGKMSHTYNQRFVKYFLDSLNEIYAIEFEGMFKNNSIEAQASIVGILRAMVMDGFVLEESVAVFEAKLWAMNLGHASEFLLRVYNDVE